MPELPEVDAMASYLAGELTGRLIRRFDVVSFVALKTVQPAPADLVGQALVGVRRVGKHVVFDVGELHVVVHLARAGWIRLREEASEVPPKPGKGPLAARLLVEPSTSVAITDAATQKKVAIHVVRELADVASIARLGPDPTSSAFTAAVLDEVLTNAGRTQLKGVLRQQSVLAGIGNAYSDEILHAARLSPFAAASSLSPQERDTLFHAIQTTLSTALARAHAVPASDLKDDKRQAMAVHGRRGLPCPACGDVVREVVFSESTLQYCATCQTDGRILKDRSTSKFLK